MHVSIMLMYMYIYASSYICALLLHILKINRKKLCRCRREMSLTREVDSTEEHITKTKSRCVPTESELEDFFAAAEKDIQKRFTDK